MADATVAPYGRKTRRPPALKEVHILCITAGLGCYGDSVSITAASQPSIEDVAPAAIPGLPKVHLHNPVLGLAGDQHCRARSVGLTLRCVALRTRRQAQPGLRPLRVPPAKPPSRPCGT